MFSLQIPLTLCYPPFLRRGDVLDVNPFHHWRQPQLGCDLIRHVVRGAQNQNTAGTKRPDPGRYLFPVLRPDENRRLDGSHLGFLVLRRGSGFHPVPVDEEAVVDHTFNVQFLAEIHGLVAFSGAAGTC